MSESLVAVFSTHGIFLDNPQPLVGGNGQRCFRIDGLNKTILTIWRFVQLSMQLNGVQNILKNVRSVYFTLQILTLV